LGTIFGVRNSNRWQARNPIDSIHIFENCCVSIIGTGFADFTTLLAIQNFGVSCQFLKHFLRIRSVNQSNETTDFQFVLFLNLFISMLTETLQITYSTVLINFQKKNYKNK